MGKIEVMTLGVYAGIVVASVVALMVRFINLLV